VVLCFLKTFILELKYLYELGKLDLKIKSGLIDKEIGLELFII